MVSRLTRCLQDRAPSFLHGRKFGLCVLIIFVLLNLILLIANTAVANNAARSTTLDAVLSHGVLRVGLTLDYPPFSLRCSSNNREAAGSDVDAAIDLAAALGVRLVIVPTTWPRLLEDAASNAFDAAAGGISITLSRLRHVGFSRPSSTGGKVIVAPCSNHLLLSLDRHNASTALPQGTTIAVNPGGTNAAYVSEHWPDAPTRVVQQGQQFNALLDGSADLTVTDEIEAALVTMRHASVLCAGAARLTDEAKAWLIPRRDDVAWAAYLNRWLLQREAQSSTVGLWLSRLGLRQDESGACELSGVRTATVQ